MAVQNLLRKYAIAFIRQGQNFPVTYSEKTKKEGYLVGRLALAVHYVLLS